jgi:hypothetical protein
MTARRRVHRKEQVWQDIVALLVLFVTVAASRAASYLLEGQDNGNLNTSLACQPFMVTVLHLTGPAPGCEDFYQFTASHCPPAFPSLGRRQPFPESNITCQNNKPRNHEKPYQSAGGG